MSLPVAEVLAERGLSTAGETPNKLDHQTVGGADAVITMGCGAWVVVEEMV